MDYKTTVFKTGATMSGGACPREKRLHKQKSPKGKVE